MKSDSSPDGSRRSAPDDYDWEAQVGAPRFRLRPHRPKWALWMGYGVSQIAGLGALALVTWAFAGFNWNKLGDLGAWTAGILGLSQFLLIPFGMGLVAAFFWLDLFQISATQSELQDARKLRKKRPLVGGMSFVNTLFACVGAFFILREGVLCLIMAFPLLWGAMQLGIWAGDHFWRKYPFLGVSLAPLFLVWVFAEAARPQTQVFRVQTTFHSKAAPEKLWRFTASYPRNPRPPRAWLHQIGVPFPLQSNGQPQVGGRRDWVLSDGVFIGEKIVKAQPNRCLEFVIDRQPKHPEIARHFELLRGRIELLPDGRGGTTLRGTSYYRLNVAPTPYFRLWSDQVVRETHWRVFEWMDELAQAG